MEMIFLLPQGYVLSEEEKRQFLEDAARLLTVPNDGHVLPSEPEFFYDDEEDEELVLKWGGQRFLQ